MRRPGAAASFARWAIFLAATAAATEAGYRGFLDCSARAAGVLPSGAVEVYVVGESTARGSPYEVSIGRRVADAFGGSIGGRPIELIELAKGGETIYPQQAALEKALLRHRPGNPGVVMIYCGHNDAFDFRYETPPFEILREEVLDRSAVLRDLLLWAERRGLAPRARTPLTYEFYLRRAIEMSLRAGLVPIPAVPASNLADVDPFLPAEGFPVPPDAAREMIAAGVALERRGAFAEARAYDRALAERQPALLPYLRYRLARCALGLGRKRAAAALLNACVEQRGFGVIDRFGRAAAAHRGAVRRLAREYGIPLVDAEREFAAAAPGGLPGYDLFIDGHHPNLEGYRLLAHAFARATAAALRVPPPSVSREAALAAADRDLRAGAEASTGRWFLGGVVDDLYPFERLNRAETLFRGALEAAPGDFSASLGLVLVEFARRKPLLLAHLKWLSDAYPGLRGPDEVTPETWRRIMDAMKDAGVSDAALKRAEDSYRAGRAAGVAAARPVPLSGTF
jgi:lysophospholipase L1-like esterase